MKSRKGNGRKSNGRKSNGRKSNSKNDNKTRKVNRSIRRDIQLGGVKCSICKAEGVNKKTCPGNVSALTINVKKDKHNFPEDIQLKTKFPQPTGFSRRSVARRNIPRTRIPSIEGSVADSRPNMSPDSFPNISPDSSPDSSLGSSLDSSFIDSFDRLAITRSRIDTPLKALKNVPYRNEIANELLEGAIPISSGPLEVGPDSFITNRPPCDFNDVIANTGGTIQYISSGSYGNAYKFCYPADCDTEYVIKMMLYDRRGPNNSIPVDSPNRAENMEVIVAKQLSTLVENYNTPHISMPICAFRCDYRSNSITELVDRIKSRNTPKDNRTIENMIRTIKATPNVTDLPVLIYVSEWARFGDFLGYLDNLDFSPGASGHRIFKVMLFQLLYTYAAIFDKFPRYRHNDLSPLNVLVQKIDIEELAQSDPPITQPYHYKCKNDDFIIPLQEASIRLWDFDFAVIDGHKNNKVILFKGDDYGISDEPSEQYDIHFFFNYLTVYGKEFYKQFDRETKQFILKWLPATAKGHTQLYVSNSRLTDDYKCKFDTIIVNKDNKHQIIRYSDLTPRFSLENDAYWNEFRTTSEEVNSISSFTGSYRF